MTNLNTNAITMLKYRFMRYRRMGDGIRCQALQRQMDELLAGKTTRA